MEKSLTSRIVSLISVALVFILLILPFHEFLTTWLASNVGHINLLRVWKEIVLVILTPGIGYLILKNKRLKSWMFKDLLISLIVVFTILALYTGFLGLYQKNVNLSALGAGFVIDIRFFLIFVMALVVAQYNQLLKKYWKQILIYPALIVVAFGIAQLFLPLNFLSHFGYGANTIPAYQLVNSDSSYLRIQSTLRGANPLGAYLVLIIPVFIFFITKRFIARFLATTGSLVTMFFTYSRSAYLGLVVTVGIIYYLLKSKKQIPKKIIYIISTFLVVLVLVGVILLRTNNTVQDIVFHTSKSSTVKTSSNGERLYALRTNTDDAWHHLLGQGVGSAGPASTHNNKPAKIAENFYIQIAQETGVLGLFIFILINIIVGYRLYLNRKDQLSMLLFASLIGISLINMVSHAWADDTLSLLWWAFAGVALSPKLSKKEVTA